MRAWASDRSWLVRCAGPVHDFPHRGQNVLDPVLVVKLPGPVDLRAQHRKGRLQLMRRILDEPALRLALKAVAIHQTVDRSDKRLDLSRQAGRVQLAQIVRGAAVQAVPQ